MRASLLGLFLALSVSLAGLKEAGAGDYFGGGESESSVVFRIDKTRTKSEKIVIGSLFGGAVVFSGIALLFTLDSKSKSNSVSALGDHTGMVYTHEVDDRRARAVRSRNFAVAGFAVGGAFLAATAVAYVITDPGTEVVDLEEYQRRQEEDSAQTTVAPVRGGVVVGKTWLF